VSQPGQRGRGPPLTVTGTMPPVAKGARVTFSGTWTQHREFGLQIRADAVEMALPDGRDVAGVEAFLAATVPGVGPKTASNLVEVLGAEKVLDVMNAAAGGDSAALAQVRKVLKGRTAALLAGWSSGALQRDAVQSLVDVGLNRGLASNAVEAKGVDVAAAVKRCPFTALRGIKGCSFEVLDDLAAHLGLPPAAPGRVQAALLDRLGDRAVKGGHAYTPLGDVARSCLDLLHAPRGATSAAAAAAAAAQSGGLPPQGPHPQVHPDDVAAGLDGAIGGRAPHEGDVYAAVEALQRAGKVVMELFDGSGGSSAAAWPSGDDSPAEAMWQHEPAFGGDHEQREWHPANRVYMASLHQDEVDVATALGARAAPPTAHPPRLPPDVAAWVAKQGQPALTEGQIECIATALTSKACILTGGPGTGKSFVTAALVKLWRQRGASVRLCAPTGRAAQRLQELLTKQGMTCLPAPPLGRPAWSPDAEGGSGSSSSSSSDGGGAAMFYSSDAHDATPHIVAAPSTVHRLLDFVPRGEGGRGSQGGALDAAGDSTANGGAPAAATGGDSDAGDALAYEGTFRRNAENPLDCDVLVVDEASMLDLPLAGALLRALPRHATLLLVGDQDQLLPVGPGSPLHDVLASAVLPVVALTEVVRTAATSLIAASSSAILAGRLPPLAPVHVDEEEQHVPIPGLKLPPPRLPWDATSPRFDAAAATPVSASLAIKAGLDALWVRLPESYAGGADEFGAGDATAAVTALQELISYTLPGLGFSPVDDLQVLSPMRKAAAGSAALCNKLGPLLNPATAAGRPRVQHRSSFFSVGDRVLQMENDYNRGVFNGDLGVVTHVQPGTSGNAGGANPPRTGGRFGASGTGQPSGRVKSMTVKFDTGGVTSSGGSSGVQTYVGDELSQLVPAWAVTVHKAQGCEFPVVALVLSPTHGISLQRNMLYTATSRASKLLIVLASRRALQQALKNTHQSGRNSHLVARLKQQLGGGGRARQGAGERGGAKAPVKAAAPARGPMPWEVPVQAAAPASRGGSRRGGWDAAPPPF
jgi:ATP-dependent exoDNAse (exonuclease V) alpha subunit